MGAAVEIKGGPASRSGGGGLKGKPLPLPLSADKVLELSHVVSSQRKQWQILSISLR